MPQMDGLACLDRIMVERPCPVVMVSSLTAEGAEATLQALRLGAIDFVAKPEGAISLHIDELRRRTGRQGARRSHRANKVERRASRSGSGIASARRRAGDPQRTAVDATPRQPSHGAPSAKGWCWSAPRPAGRRRWKRC